MATQEKQIVLIVAYPSTTPEGKTTEFNMDYYLNGHMVLINKLWTPHGMKSWTVTSYSSADSLDGSTPPYCAQATIYFDTMDQVKQALSNSAETQADIKNYTNVAPVVWVSRLEKAS